MAKTLFEQIVDRSATVLTEKDLNGITKITEYAMAYLNLDVLEIPKNINEIDGYAFAYSTLPNNMEIPKNISTIGEGLFYYSKVTKIIDTWGIDYIGELMYSNCTSLTDITIPEYIKVIKNNAFGNCTNLKKVTITKNVNEIGVQVWSNTLGAMAITDAYFQQPSGMTVTLPAAGSSTGMFYVKTARSMNVYTDNETIKNYAWSSDNITPTFYHLDGTAWA